MSKVPYTPPHMVARAERVKHIWIKEHEKMKRESVKSLFPMLISYSVGYATGGHGWAVWVTALIFYFAWFYLFRYIMRAWKINI